MKKLLLTSILLSVILLTSCEEETPTPASPTTPAPANIKLDLSLMHDASTAFPATSPQIIAVSPTGDTIASQTVNNSAITLSNIPSYMITDSAACNTLISFTVTHPLLKDGSNYKVYIYKGSVLYKTLKVEYSSVVDLGTMGGFKQCPSNYHRIIVWW